MATCGRMMMRRRNKAEDNRKQAAVTFLGKEGGKKYRKAAVLIARL
jgi:hypothetical protein